ncbi:hypothetical protein QR680_008194 [Steinernema hermaphroditum]|uniref:Fork-head domain-containing protein n=1 Tax=Steinernema hermaphroditum TaxID=289476 RepID=A0AA39II34_9BILA|nr:hypothetical protein QR680_008194 [Steinernema hermaphroditum]
MPSLIWHSPEPLQVHFALPSSLCCLKPTTSHRCTVVWVDYFYPISGVAASPESANIPQHLDLDTRQVVLTDDPMMSTTLVSAMAQPVPQQASVLDVFVSSSTASTASTATSGYGGESTSSSKSSSQTRLEDVGTNGVGPGAFPPGAFQQTSPGAPVGPPEEDELGAQTRDRSNTWPLRRPNLDINAQTSPLIHEQIPEEDNDMFGSEEQLAPSMNEPMMAGTPEAHDFDIASPLVGGPNQPPPSATPDAADPTGNASKKSTTRRNAWGNMSYADLITQAIMSSPEKKLTLSQVYEWMVQNVPYFRDKGDSNSSAGWKVSAFEEASGLQSGGPASGDFPFASFVLILTSASDLAFFADQRPLLLSNRSVSGGHN